MTVAYLPLKVDRLLGRSPITSWNQSSAVRIHPIAILYLLSQMTLYDGQRLSVRGERCTVRFVGSLRDKPGDWLGVEWDDGTKGKHNGSYGGTQYFSCKKCCVSASLPTASFRSEPSPFRKMRISS